MCFSKTISRLVWIFHRSWIVFTGTIFHWRITPMKTFDCVLWIIQIAKLDKYNWNHVPVWIPLKALLFFHFSASWSFRCDWSSSTVGKLTTCMSNHGAAPLIHPLSQSNTFVYQQTTGKYHLTAKLWNWHPDWLFVWLTSTVKHGRNTVLCGPVLSR